MMSLACHVVNDVRRLSNKSSKISIRRRLLSSLIFQIVINYVDRRVEEHVYYFRKQKNTKFGVTVNKLLRRV